jgi:hypothetical protein
MSDIVELFGHPATDQTGIDWKAIAEKQWCPYLDRKCVKVRKSQPEISIGTCSVRYGRQKRPIAICPYRLLERRQVFTDCLHLLSLHEPGNELHVLPEISLPGGSVDYFVASVRGSKVKDFVGIELQTLDTTGTVWPARQKYLSQAGATSVSEPPVEYKTYGMNWKMTAKTILIQLHHKVETLEAIDKHLVLVIQDFLLQYLQDQFQFSHVTSARPGDPMHIHAYQMAEQEHGGHRLLLTTRLSTDSNGIATCLGLQAETKVELQIIVEQLEAKISRDTLLTIG